MFKERIKIGEVVKKIEDKDMPAKFTMDGSLSPIKNPDGSITYFATDLGALPYYRMYKGTETSPFDSFEGEFFWDYNCYPEGYPNGLWALTMYRCDDGMLIGFVHRENFSREDKNSCINYHIGLGVSQDGGKHWFYAGDICGNSCNYIPMQHANMGGSPTLVKDGYFYVYYNEYAPGFKKCISAVRFSVEETIAALKNKKLPKVFKYSGNGKWETKGIGGTGAPIITRSPYSDDPYNNALDAHSKATYCKPLDCYLMTMQTGSHGDLVLYFSKDAVNWDEYMIIDSAEKDENGVSAFMLPYSSFVDASGEGRADSFEVGGKFFLHTVHKKIKDYPYDEYYVREITIE